MNCQRCNHVMIHTKYTVLEKLGDLVVIQTQEYTNECPQCGVLMRITIPTSMDTPIERG